MQGVLFARSTRDEETTAAFVNLLIVILLFSYDFRKGCTFSVTEHFLKQEKKNSSHKQAFAPVRV